MAPTEDGHVEVRGLLMGPGTDYVVESFTGAWDQLVKLADSDVLGDGEWHGVDRVAAVTCVLTVVATADTDAELQALIDAFTAAWTVGDDTDIDWQRGGILYTITGRTRRFVVDERMRAARPPTVVIDGEFRANPNTVVAGGS